MTILFENRTSNGSGSIEHTSGGGKHVFTTTGTYDGATVTIQLRSGSDPSLEWFNLTNGVLTEASSKAIDFVPAGYMVRAVIASAGGSTNLFAEVTT